jgi:hypothetical protein
MCSSVKRKKTDLLCLASQKGQYTGRRRYKTKERNAEVIGQGSKPTEFGTERKARCEVHEVLTAV